MGLNKDESDDVWKTIERDQYLSQFLTSKANQESDENPSLFTSSLTASEQLSKLTKGINLLEKELKTLIHRNHQDLIKQGTWVYKLENTLKLMQTHFQELLFAVHNVRQKIADPYNEIQTQCLILTRLHETSNLLSCIIQVQKLAKNVTKQDMLVASTMIKEVDEFCQDVDLSDIHIIENDRRIVETERRKVLSTAKSSLMEALDNENETQAAISIQVFLNLNVLEEEVQNLKDLAFAAVQEGAESALDIKYLINQSADQEKVPKFRSSGPGRVTGNTFPGVNVAAFRTKLWSNWNNLLETVVYPKCAQMYMLLLAITKQSQSALIPENYGAKISNIDVADEFWNQISEILSKNLVSAAEASSFIKQALEYEYPKLLRLYTDLIKKLQKLMKKHPTVSSKGVRNLFQNDNRFASLFENAYLSRSVSRLLDFVHDMFSGEGMPTKEEVDKFTRVLSDELKLSLIDDNLCKTVTKNIRKAIRVFCLSSEQLIIHDSSSSQVIDATNAIQQMNFNIANSAFYLKQEVQKLISKIPPKLMESCKSELEIEFSHVDELVSSIMEPIVSSIEEAIDSIILTMHRENYLIDNSQEPISSSLYMRELQRFISRTYNEYLKPFEHTELLQKHCRNLADRCIELFLRHVCLVRPLGVGGREKLSEDFKKIESAITPLYPEIGNLRYNFRILRAFRPLVTCPDPQQIASCELLGKIIPYSLAMMFMFSYAPSDILSPHESCNWSVARLSQWLDNHQTERERLELISGALQRYQQDVRQQNKTTFHDIYPVMMKILEDGFISLKTRDS